jgi:Fungal specific transcription factor domain
MLALQCVDRPSFVTLQSLVNIILYWFGAGEVVRAFIQHGVIVRLLQVLGLDKLVPRATSSAEWFEMETRGRAFWGCWLIDSFNASRTSESHALVGDSITTPLPCSESEYASKKRLSKPIRLIDVTTTDSVMAELMKAAKLW